MPIEPLVKVSPLDVPPDTPLIPFTCPWAKAGLAKAMEALGAISSSGVEEYHIGTRGLKRLTLAEQGKTVDYWNQMVKLYCGEEILPDAMVGRDTAFRVIPRDL
jgi:hypothetical protein